MNTPEFSNFRKLIEPNNIFQNNENDNLSTPSSEDYKQILDDLDSYIIKYHNFFEEKDVNNDPNIESKKNLILINNDNSNEFQVSNLEKIIKGLKQKNSNLEKKNKILELNLDKIINNYNESQKDLIGINNHIVLCKELNEKELSDLRKRNTLLENIIKENKLINKDNNSIIENPSKDKYYYELLLQAIKEEFKINEKINMREKTENSTMINIIIQKIKEMKEKNRKIENEIISKNKQIEELQKEIEIMKQNNRDLMDEIDILKKKSQKNLMANNNTNYSNEKLSDNNMDRVSNINQNNNKKFLYSSNTINNLTKESYNICSIDRLNNNLNHLTNFNTYDIKQSTLLGQSRPRSDQYLKSQTPSASKLSYFSNLPQNNILKYAERNSNNFINNNSTTKGIQTYPKFAYNPDDFNSTTNNNYLKNKIYGTPSLRNPNKFSDYNSNIDRINTINMFLSPEDNINTINKDLMNRNLSRKKSESNILKNNKLYKTLNFDVNNIYDINNNYPKYNFNPEHYKTQQGFNNKFQVDNLLNNIKMLEDAISDAQSNINRIKKINKKD